MFIWNSNLTGILHFICYIWQPYLCDAHMGRAGGSVWCVCTWCVCPCWGMYLGRGMGALVRWKRRYKKSKGGFRKFPPNWPCNTGIFVTLIFNILLWFIGLHVQILTGQRQELSFVYPVAPHEAQSRHRVTHTHTGIWVLSNCRTVSLLICPSCCNKISETGGCVNNRNLFLTALEAESPR